MKVIFLGTPDFAVPALQALYDNGFDIVGVITQPDRPRNRGELCACAVKERAVKLNLDVFCFDSIRKQGYETLKNLNADIMITCAYGQIISQEIIDLTPHGVINIHASLLPKYRGSCPIQSCLLNGDSQTGITLMRTALEVDSGDILLQRKMDIKPKTTAGQLFEQLSVLGAETLIEGLRLIEQNKAVFVPQDHSIATHYPMLCKNDGIIDWTESGLIIYNKVYALNPWPSAYTYLDNKILKIWDVDFVHNNYVHNLENLTDFRNNIEWNNELNNINNQSNFNSKDNSKDNNKDNNKKNNDIIQNNQVGTIVESGGDYYVICIDGLLRLNDIQLEGKKRMDIKDFVKGNNILGKRLSNE